MAHESRNGFQRSQSHLELLSVELEDRPNERQLVEGIQRALDHLHHLYEEVRNYAAPVNPHPQVCELNFIWRDAWAQLDLSRRGKSVELLEDIEGVDLTCEVDWFRLSQVFRNIFENSLAAVPDPGRIVVHCSDAELDGVPAICVHIQDDGPGFVPEAIKRIFDAFFTTKSKGTGLGMAIAHRIIEAHHGSIAAIGAESGAEIVITLPRQQRAASES